MLDKVGHRFEEVVQCYDKAIEVDPKYIQAGYRKGDALYIMGWLGNVLARLEEALPCFDKVLELDPQNEVA